MFHLVRARNGAQFHWELWSWRKLGCMDSWSNPKMTLKQGNSISNHPFFLELDTLPLIVSSFLHHLQNPPFWICFNNFWSKEPIKLKFDAGKFFGMRSPKITLRLHKHKPVFSHACGMWHYSYSKKVFSSETKDINLTFAKIGAGLSFRSFKIKFQI